MRLESSKPVTNITEIMKVTSKTDRSIKVTDNAKKRTEPVKQEANHASGDHVTNRVAGLSCKYILSEHKEAVSALVSFKAEGRFWLVKVLCM